MDVTPTLSRSPAANAPADWSNTTIYALAGNTKDRFDDGDWVEAEFLTDAGIRLLQTGNIGEGRFVEKTPRKYISEGSYALLRCKEVRLGDMLICRLAEPAGRACIVPDLGEAKLITAVDVTIFRPDPEKADAQYLLHVFGTKAWYDAVNERCGGSTRTRIARGALGQIHVPCPPLREQKAIAAALSDVDALLLKTESLIAKKRDMKQGAMQELLNGKRRLPGFGGRWHTRPLGLIAHIKTGGRNNQDKVESGLYPFFVRSATVERINSYSHDCEAILIPGEGGIGSIFHYITGRFDVHQRVYAITKFSPEVSGKFVHLYMAQHFGVHAMQNSVKATVDSLRLPTFQNFEVRLPPTIDEQHAIATVLTDMDEEITALEVGRDKTRALKQGMMQELLTGRIRLV